jgi:hypothetical protein
VELISGNVFIRPMGGREGLRPGQVIGGHTHNFDHTTICFAGRWRVKKWVPVVREDGSPVAGEWALTVDVERDGPFHVLIEANAKHEFAFLGMPLPEWMEPYLAKLPAADAHAFRERYDLSVGRAWCVYSHRTPQGDVSEHYTGWWDAYT